MVKNSENNIRDEVAYKNSKEFWRKMSSDIASGCFWADEIKKVRDEPKERLRIAIDNLPLPGAFREAAIALRAIIREKRKNKGPYNAELHLLYGLAARNSFYKPYAEKLRAPGFNVIQIIPKHVTEAMSFDYSTVGYKKLELLKKTDIKWIVDLWGQPKKHDSLINIYADIWNEYEEKCLERRKAEEAQFEEKYLERRKAEEAQFEEKYEEEFLERRQATERAEWIRNFSRKEGLLQKIRRWLIG